MANLPDRRRPRAAREAQAFRAAQVGGISAAATLVTLILTVVGTVSGVIPLLFAIITAAMVVRFRAITGQSRRR